MPKSININFRFLELLLLRLSSIVLPWMIFGAIPKFQFGYWGQVEGQIFFTHLICALASLNILYIMVKYKSTRFLLFEPIVFFPLLMGILSLVFAYIQRIPNLALYGSPQLGQGAFWYFDLTVMTILYFLIWNDRNWRFALLSNMFVVIFLVTLLSLKPEIGSYIFQFFFFYDYLCFFGITVAIIFVETIKDKVLIFDKIKTRHILLFVFLSLGPYFWLISNESAVLLWFCTGVLWLTTNILKNVYNERLLFKQVLNYLTTAQFFTLIIIIASLCILLSSFIFWDGKSSADSLFANKLDNYTRHLSTLIARGSIIRVLLEHFDSFKAILIGYGWGSTSDLLISSFTREIFNQINTGNRVHFHTHNELFEHFLSLGIFGFLAYLSYIFIIFKRSFLSSGITPYLWLIYFLLGCFWFQFISSLPFVALATATLIKKENYIKAEGIKIDNRLNNIYCILVLLVTILLIFGSFLGFSTNKNTDAFSSEKMIKFSQTSEKGKCHIYIHDGGRGGIHLSQMLDGYYSYIESLIDNNKKIAKTDIEVLKWYLCAAQDSISIGNSSIELVNSDINTISYLSTVEHKLNNYKLNDLRQSYLKIWGERLKFFLNLAPNRVDQLIPYVSVLLKKNKYKEIFEICDFARNSARDTKRIVAYCDLAEAAIYIDRNEFDRAVYLIERAQSSGQLEYEDKCEFEYKGKCEKWRKATIDPEFILLLNNFVKNYKNQNK